MKTKNILLLTLALMAGTSQANWFSNLTNWACNNPKTSLVVTATAMLAAAYWLFKPKADKQESKSVIDPFGISRIKHDASVRNPGLNHVRLGYFEPQEDQITIDGAVSQLPRHNDYEKRFYWADTEEFVIFYKNLENKVFQINAYEGYSINRKKTRCIYISTDDFPTLDQIYKIKLIKDNLVIFNQDGQYEVFKGFIGDKKLV